MTPQAFSPRPTGAVVRVAAAALLLMSMPAGAEVAQDIQSWNSVGYEHRFAPRWAAALGVEVRIDDTVSRYDRIELAPEVEYAANDRMSFALGFKYVDRSASADEYRIPQTAAFKHPTEAVDVEHTLRLEQRVFEVIAGPIPRLIYTFEIGRKLAPPWSVTAYEQVRFNLVDRGAGPVSGFEQNRLFIGAELAVSGTAELELGYLWRYQLERQGPDVSDHIFRVELKIMTGRGRE